LTASLTLVLERIVHVRNLQRSLAATALVLALAGAARAGDAEKGKLIYTSRCSFCHGAAGKGDGAAGVMLKPPATNFTTSEFWKTATPESMKNVIQNGKPGTAMASFKTSLNAEQIDQVIAHLQTFKPQQ
jgi:mono/diheme cytochrome c family protein